MYVSMQVDSCLLCKFMCRFRILQLFSSKFVSIDTDKGVKSIKDGMKISMAQYPALTCVSDLML